MAPAIVLTPFLLVALLIIAASVFTLYRGLSLPRSLRATKAVCGGCGYACSPGQGEICPECGSPYLEAGMVTRSVVRRLGPGIWTMIGAWAVLVIVVDVPAFPMLELTRSAAQTTSTSRSVSFNCSFDAVRTDYWQATDAPGYRLTLDGDFTTRDDGTTKSGTVVLSVQSDAGKRSMVTIDATDTSWSMQTDGGTKEGEAFTVSTALALLDAAGVDTEPAYVQREAGLITDMVAMIPTSAGSSYQTDWGLDTASFSYTSPSQNNAWTPASLSGGNSTASGTRNNVGHIRMDYTSSDDPTPLFDGFVKASHAPGEDATIEIRIGPKLGWPADIKIEPGKAEATITRGDDTRTAPADNPEQIVETARAMAELDENAQAVQGGMADLVHFIETVREDPTHYDMGEAQQPSKPERDGLPDGGFRRGSSSSNTAVPVGGMPVASFLLLLASLGVFSVGVLLIVRRRHRLFAAP